MAVAFSSSQSSILEALSIGLRGLITHGLLRGSLSLTGFTSYGMPLKIHRLTGLPYSLYRIKTRIEKGILAALSQEISSSPTYPISVVYYTVTLSCHRPAIMLYL